ncbi:MAG TPA: carboxypeptidase-like regulatory domain-containing protein, partial [Planctomycetota bacterium]|nr:carboxypeptidase-like regulatory domain-containing protein [Planctomycetota bacterium]
RGVEAGKTDLTLVLDARTGFAGRVLDEETGAAVTRFRVASMRWMEGSPGGRSGGRGNTVDSADGAFEILGVRPGTHEVTISADGFVPAKIEKVEVAPNQVRRGLEVRLARTATARGRVVDAETGAPVPGAAVAQSDAGVPLPVLVARPGNFPRGSGWTRQDGTFEVAGIAPGTVELRATREGFVEGKSEPVEVRPGAVVEGIAIPLSRGGGLDGFAIGKDGKPWVGARVSVRNPRKGGWPGNVSTDESGYFRIEALEPGEYQVTAQPPTKDSQEAQALSLHARAIVGTGKVVRVDFSPPAGTRTVRGTVRRGTEPYAKAEVSSIPVGFGGDGTGLPHALTD